jgi:hypothetical protein
MLVRLYSGGTVFSPRSHAKMSLTNFFTWARARVAIFQLVWEANTLSSSSEGVDWWNVYGKMYWQFPLGPVRHCHHKTFFGYILFQYLSGYTVRKLYCHIQLSMCILGSRIAVMMKSTSAEPWWVILLLHMYGGAGNST